MKTQSNMTPQADDKVREDRARMIEQGVPVPAFRNPTAWGQPDGNPAFIDVNARYAR